MKIGYDRAGDILLIELGDVGEGPGAREIAPGVYLDVTEAGKVLALEIIGASRFYAPMELESLAPTVEGPRDLAEAALIAGVTPVALRQAISRGRLEATKRGRDWWVEDRDLQAYMAARKGTGPKRRVVAERAPEVREQINP